MTGVEQQRMLIGGEWVEGFTGTWIDVENPSRGTTIAQVPAGDHRDVDRAVAAAAAALPAWRRMPARARGELLWRIGDLITQHHEDISRLVASETGNALRTQARGEVGQAADLMRYFGGVSSEQKGETLPLGDSMLSYSLREPIGIVGAIIPWNAPVALATLKIAPALATGNVLVLKAAEDAPLGVLRLASLCAELLPPGVLNVITGTGEACGVPLANHPRVAKLTFTGSTEVGRSIARTGGDRLVPVTLELGGKNPAIVFPDSDDDATADGVIAGMRFTRQGQSCTAGSRLFVHEDIRESFIARVVTRLEQLRVGDALDEASDMGALVSHKQFDRVCGFIAEGIDQGGSVITGGLPRDTDVPDTGYFVKPTVMADIDHDWRIAREEIFGPVMVTIPWTDLDKVIEQANDSHYGLAAFVWTHDITRALRTAHALEAGFVQVNRGLGQAAGMSYGGIKQSGLGREFSLEGALESFTHRKSLTVGL